MAGNAETFDPEDFNLPSEAYDPENFDPERHRDPIPFEVDDWETRQNQALHEYLYPEDETEEDSGNRTDILVYAGRIEPSEWLEEHFSSTPEDAPKTMREAPFLHRWRMRRPIQRMQVTTNPDAPEEEWHTLIDNTGEQKIGEVYGPKFYTRPGGASLWWVMNAAIWIEKIQVGRAIDDPEALRPELVRLLRRAVKEGPFIRLTMEDGSKIDPNEPVCRQLLRTANELDGGARVARLAIGADNLEDLPTWTPPEERDNAPASRPETPAATIPEQNGLLPWASGAPASEGVTAIRQARTGWDEKDHEGAPIYRFSQNRPFDVEGQFNIIVPRDERAFQAAEAEVAQRVLRDLGHRTARLHLACAAYATQAESGSYAPVSRKYVYDLLGLSWEARSDLSRDERDQRVEAEVDKLRKLGVQLTVLNGPNGREELTLNRVWDLGFHKWGQRRAVPDERELDTDEWRLLIRPTGWAQLYLHNDTGRQFGYFSRALIEKIDWHNNPAAGDLAIELLKYVRFQKGASRDLTVARMLEICQLSKPSNSEERRSNRQKLERAILEQERWGWEIEWTRWPSAYRPDKERCPQYPRGYWDGATRDGWGDPFHKWKVTFRPPETLAEMNSRAERVKNSAPHELEPKGWDDRIKAILKATNYSQAGLAETVEVSASAISRWKSGDRTPGPEHRAKLRDIERRRGLLDD